MTNNCKDCCNKVTDDYCTRQLDMKLAQYKQCDGFKQAIIPVKDIIKSTMEVRRLKEEKIKIQDSAFQEFLTKGGHWSFNTGEFKKQKC